MTAVSPTARFFFSDQLEVSWGCTQGDIDSPIIFNIIVDAVLWTWQKDRCRSRTRTCFYADDGLLEGMDAAALQQDLDAIIALFGRVGLKANERKTKFMIVRGAAAPKALSTQTYDNIATRRQGGTTTTYTQQRKQPQTCARCGKRMQVASMRRHLQRAHGDRSSTYVCRPVGSSGTYRMETFQTGRFNNCPVAGCTGGGTDRSTFYRHFCLQHPNADIIITDDGELAKCDLCGMRCINLTGHRGKWTCRQAAKRRYHEDMQQSQAEAE